MRIAVLSSGGKDSSAAWWWAMCRGWDVVAVVTVDVQDGDSHMFQVPSTQWVQKQAELAELPWINVPAFGSVEDEIGALESSLAQLEIDALVRFSETTIGMHVSTAWNPFLLALVASNTNRASTGYDRGWIRDYAHFRFLRRS